MKATVVIDAASSREMEFDPDVYRFVAIKLESFRLQFDVVWPIYFSSKFDCGQMQLAID